MLKSLSKSKLATKNVENIMKMFTIPKIQVKMIRAINVKTINPLWSPKIARKISDINIIKVVHAELRQKV